MLVESYECQETASESIEASEEAVKLIEELGLEGQKSILSKNDDGDARRVPYSIANAEQLFVFQVLCPKAYKLSEYKRTPIPLRVLQIAAHANSLGYFREIVVWDTESPAEKDPVLVGIFQRGQYEWEVDRYLLARWGEELESWPTLLKRALEKKRKQCLSKAASAMSKAKSFLDYIPGLTDAEVISNGPDWTPSIF